ncbi:MAG: hypothetical protein K8M05_09185 [Deltaproteobacteria bacterium]|nr:hypothetical protein [Kofleriaceae bacterium]
MGGAIGGGLGGGLTSLGAAGARFLPESAKTPLHRLAERFPTLADDAEVFAAFQRLGARHSEGVITFAIGSRRLLQLAADGAVTISAGAWRNIRQFASDTRALGAQFADDIADSAGPQLAGAGAYGDVRLNVTAKAAQPLHVPGPLDGPAVTVLKAERFADDLVSRADEIDPLTNHLGDGPETTGGMQVVDAAEDAAHQRNAKAAANRSNVGSRTPLAEHIPPPGPAFVEWWDSLTAKELNTFLADLDRGALTGARKVIAANIRHPGGLHEWLMVKHQQQIKRWGVSLQTVLDARTSTEATIGRHFKHGSAGSGTMHRQLDALIERSPSFDAFKVRLNEWADRELFPVRGPRGEPPAGRYYLPPELQTR